MKIDESKLDDLSQEELEAMEDQAVADDAAKEAEEAAAANDNPGDDHGEKTTGDDPGEKASDTKGDELVATDDSTPKEEEDLTKHVSPPSKWVAKRQAAKDTKQVIAYAEGVEAENSELKQRLEWIETRLASKGGDADLKPTDVLSPEKIANVRAEFGDEVADMFQAVRSLQGVTTVEDGSQAEVPVNAELDEAISDNDELAYWQQNSEGLWDKATSVNDKFLSDPEYQKLSFAERMYKVVEQVKADVVAEAKTTVPDKQGADKTTPPDSLSGDLGTSPTITEKSIVDRVLAADTDEAEKIYKGASEAEKEKIDIALGI